MQLEIQAPAFKEIQKDFDRKTQEQIIEKLAYYAQNYESIIQTKNVEKLQNSDVYKYRLSLDIRAIFITYYEYENGIIVILSVTSRQNAYKSTKMQKYENLANDFLKSHKTPKKEIK